MYAIHWRHPNWSAVYGITGMSIIPSHGGLLEMEVLRSILVFGVAVGFIYTMAIYVVPVVVDLGFFVFHKLVGL